jgi:hypothetical protein
MYDNGYGYGLGGDYTHVMDIASATGGYGIEMSSTTGAVGIFDTAEIGSGDNEESVFFTNHIVLGVVSILLVVNAGIVTFLCMNRRKSKPTKSRTTLNPMLRNGTVWTECDASNL